MLPQRTPSTTTNIVTVAVFASLALATNYPLIGIPNIKLMDVLVFLSAFLFGLKVGVGVAVSTRVVYGLINPLGPADVILLSFLIVGECFFALAGAALRRTNLAHDLLVNGRFSGRFSLVFGTAGLLATLGFDVLTNSASWLFLTSSLYDSVRVGLITGAPFSLIHEISNLILFATAAPAAIVAVKRFIPVYAAETRLL